MAAQYTALLADKLVLENHMPLHTMESFVVQLHCDNPITYTIKIQCSHVMTTADLVCSSCLRIGLNSKFQRAQLTFDLSVSK